MAANSEFIPIYRPSLSGNEKRYVNECLDSTWISSQGKFVERFEKSFSDYTKINNAASVCNGTVALHLALLALGIGKSDEVIVPTLTYIATVNAVAYVGAKPIFADSERGTWQIDPEDVKRKITPRTKAVIVVHLFGYPADMARIMDIAAQNGLHVIEDCAEAFGTQIQGKTVGTFGDIATFSFYGNKTITTGEGGIVATNTLNLHEKVCHLKGQGLSRNRFYWHDALGYNYRMTNICAAIGLAQLERADEIIEKKIRLALKYDEVL
ncbi:MAG: DegT/DnrJ/EryC1/StrS aminotransferase family protein, partial [Pseudomonadota bacterium]